MGTTCPSGTDLPSAAACEAAAAELGMGYRSARTEDVTDWPSGCYIVTEGGVSLWFNSGSGASQGNAAPICVGKLRVQWTIATILVDSKKAALLPTCRCPPCVWFHPLTLTTCTSVENAGIDRAPCAREEGPTYT